MEHDVIVVTIYRLFLKAKGKCAARSSICEEK